MAQKWQLPDEDEVKKIKSDVYRENRTNIEQKSKDLFETVSLSLRRAMELSQEKGSSSWLKVIPLKEIGFDPRTRKETSVRNQSLEIEKRIFTPLVFTTAGGIGEECLRYHRKPAEFLL